MIKKLLTASIAGAGLFTVLFYKRDLGLNLLLFETMVLILLVSTGQIFLKSRLTILTGLALLVTLVFTIINYSAFGYIIHFMVGLLFIGVLAYPYARSFITVLKLSAYAVFSSQRVFIGELAEWARGDRGAFRGIYRLGIFLIPAFIVVLFFLMYQRSNPVFERIFSVPMEKLQVLFNILLDNLNFPMIFTFLFGLILCNIVFLRKADARAIIRDRDASDEWVRRKERIFTGRLLSLKREYRAAVFLFFTLNLLLLLLNITDVYAVWFHFEWKGQYLKQYVHEGTYLLILSILLSLTVVLYYFRGNLNHYPGRFLKVLTAAWLLQNAVLLLSVSIRNFWYIHYFALAYKRIGVYIFLTLTLFGLYSVWLKVQKKKSMFYLCRVNAAAWVVVLTVSSLVNWDVLIARYNFSRSGKAFLHLNFLATLPDKTLPYLDKPYEELLRIDAMQRNLFHFNERFMEPVIFYGAIQERKQVFKKKWERKDWLEWNYPEWWAYRKL